MSSNPRVLYMGMPGDFSLPPLRALIEAGAPVCAVVVPASAAGLPAQGPPLAPLPPARRLSNLPLLTPFVATSILHLAWERGIPAYAARNLADPEALALLAAARPAVGAVACFSQRIPATLLALPPHGIINIHPSLLPAHRGPAPLFWTFRAGQEATGVTIHIMDEGLDTGDIVAQAPVELPAGASGAAADLRCAAAGGQLLVRALQDLGRGQLARRPQPPGGSYEPWPTAADFAIDSAWPARRAYHFMRGTAEWGLPYLVTLGDTTLQLAGALGYEPGGSLGAPYLRAGGEVLIQLSPGVLRARI